MLSVFNKSDSNTHSNHTVFTNIFLLYLKYGSIMQFLFSVITSHTQTCRQLSSFTLIKNNKEKNLRGSKVKWVLGEQADSGIGTGREDPRLRRVEGHVEDAQVVGDHMTSEDLDWDDQRILQQVAEGAGQRVLECAQQCITQRAAECVLLVNGAVTHDNRSVI